MGYTTEFEGKFDLDKPLTLGHKASLDKFARERHEECGLPGGYWCQWVPNDDGTAIEWDGGEKFYFYVEWIKYLVANFIKPWGYVLNGTVEWHGEKWGDMGRIVIEENEVITQTAIITWK